MINSKKVGTQQEATKTIQETGNLFNKITVDEQGDQVVTLELEKFQSPNQADNLTSQIQ